MTQSQQLAYYDDSVRSIIAEIVSSNRFPQFEVVLREFLLRFGVPSLRHLGFNNLPVLDLLIDVQQKVSAFVSAYVGTQSIVCLVDLEWEVYYMLKSFNIPSIRSPADDSNEVNIDSENSKTPSFFDLGIGPLHLFPSVMQLFPFLDLSKECLSVADVITNLEEYSTSTAIKSKVDCEGLKRFLCERYSVDHHNSLGVYIKGSLRAELLMIQHVAKQRDTLLLNLQKQYFENLNCQYGNDATSATPSSKKDPRESCQYCGEVELEISPPSRLDSSNLLARFEDSLSSTFHPTFSKALNALERIWKDERHLIKSTQQTTTATSKKRKREKSTCHDFDLTKLEKEMLHVCTEYIMLHVGGNKYRKKRLHVLKNDKTQQAARPDDCTEHKSSNYGSDQSCNSEGDNSSSLAGCDGEGSDISSVAQEINMLSNVKTEGKPQFSVMNSDGMSRNENCASCRPFEGKMALNGLRAHPTIVEATDLSALLPWFQKNNSSIDASSAEDGNLRAVGKWGESLVYQYLLLNHPEYNVVWLNEEEETNASYDIKMERKKQSTSEQTNSIAEKVIFVEVKTTRFSEKNVFQISKWEWDFICKLPRVQYDIYRVYNAGSRDKVKLAIYHDIYKLVEERRVQLCLAV